MQFPKIAFVICAFALVATGVRAEDNADQAAARALLVSKLFEISGESTPTNTVNQQPKPFVPNTAPSFSTTTKVIPAAPVESAVVMRPVNQVSAPRLAAMPMLDSEAHYRILRSPRQEMEIAPKNWSPSVATADRSYSAKPELKTTPKNSSASAQTISQSNTTAPEPMVKTSSEFAPISAPASPIGAGKQQKLLDLLTKYKADQISPEEYHRQRAAIINGM